MTTAPADDPELGRILFADLAEELDGALAASRLAAGHEPRVDPAVALVERAARDARDGDLGRAAFAGIDGLEVDRFERAFGAARVVASWGGLTVPDPDAFWDAGSDRAALARALIADATLVPVPAPAGLGVDEWTQLFRAAARQPSSPLSLAAPLVLAPEVRDAFDAFDLAPRNVPTVEHGRGTWTLRLVPAASKPPIVGLSHLHGPHPTLPELLMLQLMRFAAGEEPLDRSSFTWVSGAIGGGKFAARQLFDATERGVRVNTREVGNQGPHLGARPPIG